MVADNNANERSASSAAPVADKSPTTSAPSTDSKTLLDSGVPKADGPPSNRRHFDSSNRGRGRGRGGQRGRGGGGRGGRGGRDDGGKRKQVSRQEYSREHVDKRTRNTDTQDRKRRKVGEDGTVVSGNGDPSYMSIPFAKEEIEAEERRPKRKVAVMVGYAGTGYHGMQINHKDKTIEGDIFAAFVAANAISKANADDPRKSSLVRCARTDKGVHAAGNVISLKLIIEDPDIVKKINDALPPQIRVWGIQRTNNAFSCYQTCDSRWYEYLMPSYCLLPPHPETYLGKKVLESIKEQGQEEAYARRMADVKDFWEDVEKNEIQPIIDALDPETREQVLRRLHAAENDSTEKPKSAAGDKVSKAQDKEAPAERIEEVTTVSVTKAEASNPEIKAGNDVELQDFSEEQPAGGAEPTLVEDLDASTATLVNPETTELPQSKVVSSVDLALKAIKATYVSAKRRYRVTPERLNQLQETLSEYVGTHNYHNYTIQKGPSDPSAKRHIKSFVVNPNPIQINDTQWLSLKVHGQSFMMHQIRKMVGMAVLVTRCATPLSRISESYDKSRISIPKAPGLGLLLERPVFENYNARAKGNYERPEIDFANYEKEIQEFKDTQIYNRIFELEEKENSFHTFFHQIDSFKSDYFLWVTAGGITAAHQRVGQVEDVPEEMKEELGDEGEDPEGGEG
ncbi:pseudouridine synthase [Pseudomassariella vexata]|uniref:tRNA pseudouridine synthase 1 n=1 Tax=Pseudomassariella vexata TaxID=1141098 RepID=A0A1Y2DXK4_9PEZI|nr:pseudouridine synthase [Pseudomassariella vexata]ORY63355.1 pseudouridine synthase [Pseudomassariella vexata]